MKKTVAIIGALDTKGQEFKFLKDEIEQRGCETFVINVGVLGEPPFVPDISAAEVARAGGEELSALIARADRGEAMAVMTGGVTAVVGQQYAAGKFEGIISMGGGGGTAMGTSAMRALPVGVPKLMVTTVASGDTSQYVGTSDIVMMPSIVDVAGLNRISRTVFSNAAGAICGMVSGQTAEDGDDKPLIAATMFGNTTRAVEHARQILEESGYEVLVFHATGTGGRTMETLAESGFFVGVLDITTTEWADEVCGGVLSAGSERLGAAGKAGIPQVVTPACIDMCNFWARDTVPAKYNDRLFYEWNPNVTLMRTTPEENEQMGKIFAAKLNAATGPVKVFIPMGGFSELDYPGQPFWWPEANQAFVDGLQSELNPDIPVVTSEKDVNDPEFSGQVAQTLLEMLSKGV
ncbi:MAG: Tm-1-like ATP-binding domain-containing protein [Candidatus Promineifilaceae bacterium]|nr:Tm-1-like ATP-binding domain-containing protein [Candidatus Promineifilaceae bacterium]